MPSYTILFMRKDVTDRRPVTVHISGKLLWTLILTAVALPIIGFMVSLGFVAPAWLKVNVHSMEQAVETAEKTLQPLQQQNADLAKRKGEMEAQLKQLRELLAQTETKFTMAETARTEASTRLGNAEAELITLKKSLATYEKLLKPKLSRELVECVDLTADYSNGQVSYKTSFAKISKTSKVPDLLTARVRVLTGDNAVAMEQGQTGNNTVNHQLEINRSPSLKGQLALPSTQAEGTTRMVDVKVYDGNTPVGYCWKTF